MDKRLDGRRILITGGNSGIGLASATLFSAHGAKVAITGRDSATLESAAQQLGPSALVLRSDVSKLSDIDSCMHTIKERWGGLDVLFANAAVVQPVPFALIDEATFDQTMAVNFKGVFFTIQRALPLLSKGASVIVTTSISYLRGCPAFGVYGSAKAALRSLVQTLSLELAERQIRVNALCPGPTDTPGFGRWGVPQEVVEMARRDFTQRSPAKRFASADELANVALFLASSDASYVSGAEIVADAGFTNLL